MKYENKSYIVLNRITSGFMRGDPFEVTVNGISSGHIKDSRELTMTVRAGWNRITLSKGIIKSKPLVFKMSEGMIINLECGCSMNLLTAPLELLYECLLPGHCIFLRRTFLPSTKVSIKNVPLRA